MGSEQVAAVLRQAGSHVRLIVARPVTEPPSQPDMSAPVVPTESLDVHLQQINNILDGNPEIIPMTEEQIQMQQVPQVITGNWFETIIDLILVGCNQL